MQETTRLHYLRALGVSNYMPRWQLTGAPPSVLNDDLGIAWEESVSATETPSPNDTPQKSAQQQHAPVTEEPKRQDAALNPTAAVLEALAPSSKATAPNPIRTPIAQDQPQSPSTPKAAPQTQQRAPAKPESSVSFALSFWRIADDLLVVDSRHSELALPVEKLLNNIVFALGYPRQLPKVDVISWPLLDAPHHDQSESAAREMLHAYLDGQLLLHPGKFILLMGEDASRFLLEEDSDFQQRLGKQFAIEAFDLTAVVVPSLSTLLQDPDQKSLTWQAIQPLRLT